MIEHLSTKDSPEIWKKTKLLKEKQILCLYINQQYIYNANY